MKSEQDSFEMPNLRTLRKMSKMGFEDIDPDALANLEDIHIDPSLDCKAWQRELIAQTGNPFFMKIEGYTVRMTI